MDGFPKDPAELATPEELARARSDRPFAARLIMGRCVPFNNLLGLTIEEVTPTRALLRLPFRPEHTGDPFRPALHGGALATLADTAGGTVVIAATEHQDRIATLDMRVDYLRPAELADTFAEALVVRVGARAAVVRIHVYQADEAEPDGRRHVSDSTAVYSISRAES
ncbi:MAG: PaaI family thioesterase [Planctomycetota bacterium]|nr:PaaI family thioesterase [Planctomycetota bacterium]